MALDFTAGAFSSPVPAPVAACFHCGLPVVGTRAYLLPILGQTRALCCAGCEAVARTIVKAGLESYYETRDVVPALEAVPAGLPAAEIYDDPLAQAQFVSAQGEHRLDALLVLDRIRCAACVWLNERYLRAMPGVLGVTINYTTRRAQIAWDPRTLRLSEIIAAIRGLGYDAFPFDPSRQRLTDRAETRAALWRLFVAGFGAMQVMMYAVPRYIDTNGTLSAEAEQILRWASLVLTLPVILFACGPFFSSALTDLRARRLGIDVPISLGILAGFLASAWATFAGEGEVYFDSITMLVFLLLGARALEAGARRKAALQLDRLARWMPAHAMRLPGRNANSAAERVAAHELRPGDWVLVAAGDTIPADGIVESGSGSADESLLTGESRPVIKRAGCFLIGGSVNIDQPLIMRVTQAGAETRAAAIGRLLERAAAGKPRLVESVDRVAHRLTWVVIGCAIVAYAGWSLIDPARAFWVAVAVLVVTCPCALGLAAPIALTSATGALARRGMVLTRARAIESLATVTDVVLDKTGTLTEGHLRMTGFAPLGRLGRDACLDAALALEAGSLHPVARALRGCADRASMLRSQQAVHFPGSGIEASVGARRTRIGTGKFVGELCGELPVRDRAAAQLTHVYLGDETGWLACFVFEDKLRSDAREMVDALRAQGLRIHLLSGDASSVVTVCANLLGIQIATGDATPQDKHAYVAKLQREGRRVAMLGDGLNDAPVLAQSDVSIAMGDGAALARMNADLVLLSGRLSGVLEARSIALRAMRVIRQNFGWAVVYNGVALPLAVLGLLGPWEAAIGMTASSFAVVMNSARLAYGLR